MRASPDAALAAIWAAVPLVPVAARWTICEGCHQPREPYDGQRVCERCVMESFAESG